MKDYDLIKLYEYGYYPYDGHVTKLAVFAKLCLDGTLTFLDGTTAEYADYESEKLTVNFRVRHKEDCCFDMLSTRDDAEADLVRRGTHIMFDEYAAKHAPIAQ